MPGQVSSNKRETLWIFVESMRDRTDCWPLKRQVPAVTVG